MKITITREIEVPDSVFCKKCKAMHEYEIPDPDFRAAYCCNFNDRVFASGNSGWQFVKCDECMAASRKCLHGGALT